MGITDIEIKEMAEANDMKLRRDAGIDMYEDAGGHIVHESEIIEMIEQERLDQEAEWHKAEDEARRSADKLCSNESRI